MCLPGNFDLWDFFLFNVIVLFRIKQTNKQTENTKIPRDFHLLNVWSSKIIHFQLEKSHSSSLVDVQDWQDTLQASPSRCARREKRVIPSRSHGADGGREHPHTTQRSSPLPPSWMFYLKSSSKMEMCTFPPFFQPKQAKKIYRYKEWEIPLSPKWLEHASKVSYLKLGKKLESPKTHLASFEEQALLPKLAWSNCFPWGEQGIWLWWVKSCNSADFQKALRDIRIQIWWKANETFTPKSLRSFWNFAHLSSKPCWSISLGNLRGWCYIGINSHFIDEETEVRWRAKGHTRSRVKGFRWRRISKVREGCFITLKILERRMRVHQIFN